VRIRVFGIATDYVSEASGNLGGGKLSKGLWRVSTEVNL